MELDPIEKEAFVSEVGDRLEQYGESLLDFENRPDDPELLNSLFRIAHTIKGNAGFVGLDNLVRIAHATENLFVQLRERKLRLDRELFELILAGNDLFRRILDEFVAAESGARAIDADGLAARIDAALAARLTIAAPAPATAAGAQLVEVRLRVRPGAPLPGMRAYLIRTKLAQLGRIMREDPPAAAYDEAGFDGVARFVVESVLSIEDLRRGIPGREIESLELTPVSPEHTEPRETTPAPEATPHRAGDSAEQLLFTTDESDDLRLTAHLDAGGRGAAESLDILRVPVKKIDALLNLVGELLTANSAYLVLAAEMRARFGSRGLYAYFRENSEELGRISAELQERVMKVRMVPVGTIFSRFRRLVRDFDARTPDKNVQLILEGEETEIDKKQIENIYDPLLHLVRNCMDHGIEPLAERQARGKPATGTIRLRGYSQGNNIVIEVGDDGRGLDLEKIRGKAAASGLVEASALAQYGERDLVALIFLPGFSTSEQVTDLSGRGVGMDVVKQRVEALNGRVEVNTVTGVSTLFRITLPLSMAIVTALKVHVDGRLFAIPINVILETLKVAESEIRSIEGTETIEVRGEHVTLLRAARELGLKPTTATPQVRETSYAARKPVVIVQYDNTRIGLQVDKLIGYEDMVVKSLSKNYEDIEGLAGAAILGRGEICLIMDVDRFLDRALGRGTSRGFAAVGAGLQAARVVPSAPERTAAAPAAGPVADTSPAPTASRARLSDEQLGRLRRVIATMRQNALAAVRQLTNRPEIQLRVTTTRIQSGARFREQLRNESAAQANLHACYVQLRHDWSGAALVLLSRENVLALGALMYGAPRPFQELDSENISAIREMTNILAVSFTNALAVLAGVRTLPTAPEHTARIPDGLAHVLPADDQTIVLIETELVSGDRDLLLRFYVFPEEQDLNKIAK